MNTMLLLLLTLGTVRTAADAEERSLLIVTTGTITRQSALLASFITEKQRRGFRVEVATEADYGGPGELGAPRAARIRTYLQAVHQDFRYLLLVGNPHPDFGDLPMTTVWPRHTYPEDWCQVYAGDCRFLPTDYMYADLSGDWDLNGDGRPGETGLDEGPGGIDWEPELIVGRIPVYYNDMRELDRTLANAIAYMNEAPDAIGWRRSFLFPAAYLFFVGDLSGGVANPFTVDGADVMEWFIANVLDDRPEYAVTRMYEEAGHLPSAWESDVPLTEENLVATWAGGFGNVFWAAHGLDMTTSRVIWEEDLDGDGRAAGEVISETMLASGDAPAIGGTKPAFVSAISCEVGSADVPYNLAYSLLLHNAAIGIMAATSPSSVTMQDWSDLNSALPTASVGSDNMGILFFEGLLGGKTAGQAFYDAKTALSTRGDITSTSIKMMVNYYGDPTLTLSASSADVLPVDDPPEVRKGDGCSASPPGGTGASWAWWLPLLVAIGARRWRKGRRSVRRAPGL